MRLSITHTSSDWAWIVGHLACNNVPRFELILEVYAKVCNTPVNFTHVPFSSVKSFTRDHHGPRSMNLLVEFDASVQKSVLSRFWNRSRTCRIRLWNIYRIVESNQLQPMNIDESSISTIGVLFRNNRDVVSSSAATDKK